MNGSSEPIQQDVMMHTCQECGDPVPLKKDKRGKFYYTCDDCGVQHFIRYPEGMNKCLFNIEQKKRKANKQEKSEVVNDGNEITESNNENDNQEPAKKSGFRVGCFGG